jgi:hypothetical protein
MRSTTSPGRDASLITPPMRDSRHLLIALWIVALLSGLTACDPGYGFTVHNPCHAPMTVDLRDSDEFKRVGISPVTIEPHSTSTWTQIDPDINAPFGALLLDGPREGELIKSETPEVTIPESACAR